MFNINFECIKFRVFHDELHNVTFYTKEVHKTGVFGNRIADGKVETSKRSDRSKQQMRTVVVWSLYGHGDLLCMPLLAQI